MPLRSMVIVRYVAGVATYLADEVDYDLGEFGGGQGVIVAGELVDLGDSGPV